MVAWVGGWGAASPLVVGLFLLWLLHCGAFELAKSCWCRVPWFLSFSSWSEDRCQRRVEAKVSVRTVTQLRGRTGRPSPLCLRRPVLPQIGKTRQDQARPSRAAHLGTAPLWSSPPMLSTSTSTSPPTSGGRYPIWFNSILNFAKKMIHSIFDSILLCPRFNSKYYSIQKKFCWFNSNDNSIQ